MRERANGVGLLLLAAGCAVGAAGAASAANLFVYPNVGGAICSQLTPCSLATALAQAVDGDSIFVTAGTYTGTGDAVATITKSIRLYGGWNGLPSGGPIRNRSLYVSVIDGEHERRGVTIDGDLTVTIDGFTIINGNASGLTTHCVGSSGPPAGCGGGVFVYQAAATISNCIVRDNVAATGGALPPLTTAYGGGIYGWNSSGLDIRDNTITGNTASDSASAMGGGVLVVNCPASARVSGNLIAANTASGGSEVGWGGGLALDFGGTAVEGNVIASNRASAGTNSLGSGIFVWYGWQAIGGNTIIGNHDDDAVYLGYFWGVFASNRVVANPAETAVNLVHQQGLVSPLLVNNVIEATGTYGVFANSAAGFPLTVTLDHNTIAGNGETTGVYANTTATVLMTNNILANHAIALDAAGGAVLTPDRTLFWNNDDDGIRGFNPRDGNPNFVNALARDFRLRPGSAAQDVGVDVGVATDIDGHSRPLGDGPDIGAFEAPPAAFDFGTQTSPVTAGRVRVSQFTGYSESTGFGWASGAVNSRDRLIGTALTRDFAFSPLATFALDVPDGPYDVSITAGDAAGTHDQMGFFLEGALVDTITTGKNQFVTRRFRVDVHDGQLTLGLDDLGGADINVVINGLAVRAANTWKGDFGTAGSPTAAGFTQVTGATAYSSLLGFGWQSGAITSRDRGPAHGDLARDFNVTTAGTFAVDLAADAYVVRALTGDADRAHDQMRFGFENPASGFDISTQAGTFKQPEFRIGVTDGQLNVFLADGGGADPNVVINALDAAPEDRLRFDFGTAASPVAAWYTQVTPATAYTPLAGFGWLLGTVDARNRAAGTDLTRDFNFSPDATFAADLPNRSYEVTITMGDATTRHELMGIFIEGALVDTVTTLAGQFVATTYPVQVSDGQLTVRIADTGGGDPNAVISALEVR